MEKKFLNALDDWGTILSDTFENSSENVSILLKYKKPIDINISRGAALFDADDIVTVDKVSLNFKDLSPENITVTRERSNSPTIILSTSHISYLYYLNDEQVYEIDNKVNTDKTFTFRLYPDRISFATDNDYVKLTNFNYCIYNFNGDNESYDIVEFSNKLKELLSQTHIDKNLLNNL